MLASDVNNPEFVGAQNPDALLHVEFFWAEPIDKWASEEKGKEVRLKKQPFVRIMKPGDSTSILETAVREDHKARWPNQWLYWQMKEGLVEDGSGIPGWRIEEWPELANKPEQLRELHFLRFFVVEQIAGASDHQIQKMGMAGPGLRERARAAMRDRMNQQVKDAMKEKDATIAAQGTTIAEQGKQLAELQAQMAQVMDQLTKPKKAA